MSFENLQLSKKKFVEALHQGKILSFEELSQSLVQNNNENNTAEDLSYFHLLKSWYTQITELPFLDQDLHGLEEIIIQDPTYIVFKYNRSKKIFDCDLISNDLQIAFEVIAQKEQKSWNFKNPFISFYSKFFDKNVRISMSHFSISPEKKSKVYIRFLNETPYPVKSFTDRSDLVSSLISNKKNILVAGATGSGKTSFLNALLSNCSKEDHLIIMEDTYELVSPHENTSRLITNNNENQIVTLNDMLTYAMRMSPDRMVLGELRGKEIETYLMSINTGHKGVLSTLHANSAVDALTRLSLMFKVYSEKEINMDTILKLLCQNIDYVVFLKDKKVTELIKVYSSEKDQVFYEDCLHEEVINA